MVAQEQEVSSSEPFGSESHIREEPMAFTYKLEREDGLPADPPMLRAAVPNWSPGDTIPLPQGRMLRVVATRLDEGFGRRPRSGPRRRADVRRSAGRLLSRLPDAPLLPRPEIQRGIDATVDHEIFVPGFILDVRNRHGSEATPGL
jgi:hypothetical protein